MSIVPRFFAPLGTVPHAERLAFLTQDVRAAGTVFGFYGASAAIGARPGEMALMVVRRYRPEDLHRQVVLVFQQDRTFAGAISKLYAARGKPLGFEGQHRWCAIPEPGFLADETYALLAQRFPTLLLIEEQAEKARIVVFGSDGFKQRPPLKLAPLPKPVPVKPLIVVPPPKPKAPQPIAKVVPLRPRISGIGDSSRPPLPPLPLSRRRRLRSVVALNEKVERQVVDEFRRLLTVLSHYG
jgi:hypothetical protein